MTKDTIGGYVFDYHGTLHGSNAMGHDIVQFKNEWSKLVQHARVAIFTSETQEAKKWFADHNIPIHSGCFFNKSKIITSDEVTELAKHFVGVHGKIVFVDDNPINVITFKAAVGRAKAGIGQHLNVLKNMAAMTYSSGNTLPQVKMSAAKLSTILSAVAGVMIAGALFFSSAKQKSEV